MAQYNITVDDTDRTAIEYYPPDCGWIEEHFSYHHNRTLTYCESDGKNDPKAVFRFTGVAIYYLLRLHEAENLYLSLDGLPRWEVNLTSPTGEYIDSAVLWSATNLPNQEHRLEVLPGNVSVDGLVYVNVDAFIYTAVEVPSQAETSATPTPSPHRSTPTGTIAAGVVGAGVAIMLAVLGFFIWRRMVTKKKAKEQMAPSETGYSEKDIASAGLSSPIPSTLLMDPMVGIGQDYVSVGASSQATVPRIVSDLPDYASTVRA